MIRLFLIRFLETYFRHPVLYLLPAVAFTLLGAASAFTSPPEFVTAGTVHIRPRVGGSNTLTLNQPENVPRDQLYNPAELLAYELGSLLRTNRFAAEVKNRLDFSNPALVTSFSHDDELVIDHIQDQISIYPLGDNQVDIVAFSETPALAVALIETGFQLYVERKISESQTDTQVAQDTLRNLVTDYARRRTAVEDELSAYIASHPQPPTTLQERPEAELLQITRLQTALDRADDNFTTARYQLENADLIQATTAENIRQTFIMVDAPFEPIQLTSLTGRVTSVIQAGIAGLVLGVIGVVLTSAFDRRLMLPLDTARAARLPVLALVEAPPAPWPFPWRLLQNIWPFKRARPSKGS